MKKFLIISLLFLLFLLFTPFVVNASLNTNLYYGLQQNSDVTQLQNFLHDKGFLTANATGNFYSLTINAVKKYQASRNINQTGYVGILTRIAINRELATDTAAALQAQIKTLQGQLSLLQQQNVQVAQSTQSPQTTQQQTQTIQQVQQGGGTQVVNKIITSFQFTVFNSQINGQINNDDHTIIVVVPDGADLTNLTPIIQISDNAAISPGFGIAQDFTDPVTYTVTDVYGGTQDYIVSAVTESNGG